MPGVSWTLWLIWLCLAYLAGSIPFGLLMGRLRGVDIRLEGSGNVGATNTGRVLGPVWGLACFLLDGAKGLVPVLGYRLAVGDPNASALSILLWFGVGAAAVMGHIWSLWLGFRGGKGVATGLGVVLGMWPVLTLPGVAGLLIWIIVLKATGYISVASMSAACAMPVLTLISALTQGLQARQTLVFVAVTALLAALVVLRHRSNLSRLRAGTEPKVHGRSPDT